MDGNDKISIIMPAYNAERYIRETIGSILDQTYDNYEIIVIDDGSTDGTGDVIRDINCDKIRYFRQENMGQSVARNVGLRYVTGGYISFVDSDDILNRDFFKELLTAIKKDDSDMAVCGYEKFYDDTKRVFYRRIPKDWDIEFDNGIRHVFIYSPWAKLYKTDFIKKYDLKFSEGEQLEDGPYSCLADLLASNVATSNYIGLRYRAYDNSTMGNIRKKNSKPRPPYNGVRIMIDKFNRFNANESKVPVMEYCTIKILAGFVTNMYKNVDKQSRKEICAYCHEIMETYFSNARKNRYTGIFRLRKFPLSHRIGVKLFIVFDRLNLLYPFSLAVSKVL